ncbi:MAG TPA: FAD-dependent oxidoreductase [Nocardioides sp.]
MTHTRPRVVIVGMGDTGVLTAIQLAPHADVVGISTKAEFVSGQELGLRLARPEAWMRDYRVGFDRFRGLDGVRIVHGTASSLHPESRRVSITLADGTTTTEKYDVLVIAAGVTNGFWREPSLQTSDGVSDVLARAHARLADAAEVVVIGGGAAAMSSAAQVAERWPDKQVHVYFPGERGLPLHHPRAWNRVARRLTGLGVALHPGHRAVLPADGTNDLSAGPVRWQTGQPPTEADVVLWAIGQVQPNTGWLPAHLLDDRGFVLVEPTLAVSGQDHIFAVGDIAAVDALRTSARNQGHKLVGRNVRAHVAGRSLGTYRTPGRRWGSVLGPLRDGLVVFAPNGRGFRFPAWSIDALLQRFVVRRGIYGGVRRD